MTITELLGHLSGAFPAFNAKAMEAWASVFRARLGKHEGPVLARAYSDTLGAFSVAKSKSLFPVPADFEVHLPSKIVLFPKSGPRIDLNGHKIRKHQLETLWWQAQGSRIQEARGSMIAAACRWEVTSLAQVAAWSVNPTPILLTLEQINICEERVVSSERLAAFGPYSLRRPDPTEWRKQMEETRILVRANRRPARKVSHAES